MAKKNQFEYDSIVNLLKDRSSLKQFIHRNTSKVFVLLKIQLAELAEQLKTDMNKIDPYVKIDFIDKGDFEAELHFSGDVLIFSWHTNVFNFPPDHDLHKMVYVKNDPDLSYCGLLQIHNFLYDSLKYNRTLDLGYLLARIFINKENHFFLDGSDRLGFPMADFKTQIIDAEKLRTIVLNLIMYTLKFDLLTPPFDAVRELPLSEKLANTINSSISTNKVGFRFKSELKT